MSEKAGCCGSNCKNPKEHSDKACVCGGHNHNNPKKSRPHNGTKQRNTVRKSRKVKEDKKWGDDGVATTFGVNLW